MGISLGSSLLLLIVTILGLAVLSFFVYRSTTPALVPSKKYLLATIRFLALALIAFLLFRPEFRSTRQDTEAPVVAILLDDSESLKATMTDSLTGSGLAGIRDLAAELEGVADVVVYSFGADTKQISASLDSTTFQSQRTNISAAIEFAARDLANQNLQSIVLVSDGRYNTGSNPLYLADELAIPIVAVTVGDTTAFRDIRIQRVETNELAYVGITLPVDVTVQANGFENSSVSVALVSETGAIIDNADVTLLGSGQELTVPLEVTPTEQGTLALRAVVTRVTGEETFRNNTEPVSLRVLKSQKRILLVASRPSPDVSVIKTLIESSESFSVTTFIEKAPGRYYEGSFTARPDTFDLAVLVGYPAASSSAADLKLLADALGNNLPLLFLYQRNSDLERLASSFQGLLPVVLETARAGLTPSLANPTNRILQHAITRDLSTDLNEIRKLPPLLASNARWQLSPGAVKLFTATVRDIELTDPLVAVINRPGYRSVAILGEGLYLWNNLPEDLDQLDGFLDEFVTNMITWLTAGSDERLVRVASTENMYGGGETIRLTGQAYDESLNPVEDASFDVDITGPDGRDLPYIMDNNGGGRYSLSIGSLPEGTYRFHASASANDRIIGVDEGTFAVGQLTLEFKNTTADPFFMRQLATRSGGFSTLVSESNSIVQQMNAAGILNSREVETVSRIRLWQRYPFLLLITALLTVEWFVRKRSGLV